MRIAEASHHQPLHSASFFVGKGLAAMVAAERDTRREALCVAELIRLTVVTAAK